MRVSRIDLTGKRLYDYQWGRARQENLVRTISYQHDGTYTLTVPRFSVSFVNTRLIKNMSNNPSTQLKIVIIRHGEKPEHGDNLTPQGLNRALQLPDVLIRKVGLPDSIYVPTLDTGVTTLHSRMFQTATPLAVQHNLSINSQFDEKDAAALSTHLRQQTGTFLVVWEHHMIPEICKSLGIDNPPQWEDADFDSIWIVTFTQLAKAVLTIEHQHIT